MPTRLVILADVHLGTAATQFPGQDYTYTPDLLRRAVAAILPLQPERVLLLGDLVNMGAPEEYAIARQILAPLSEMLEPIPGNHELVRGTLADFQRQLGHRPWRQAVFETLPAVFLNSAIDGLPPTQWHGHLDSEQLEFLDEALQAKSQSPVLTFAHHPLANSVRRSDEPMMSLDNSAELERRMDAHPHDVVLFSGHTHYQSILYRPRYTCVACPPICFWPHAFLVVDVDGKILRLSTIRLFDRWQDSPDPKAADENYRRRSEGTATDQNGTIVLT